MGGRINGFLGGLLLTGSLAYLTALEFHGTQKTISRTLNDTTELLHNHGQPVIPKSNLIYFQRRTVCESVKDIWNHDIIRGVTWLYSLDATRWSARMVDALTPKH